MFTVRYKLRFGQSDPAGIAFFPRLVEMLNWAVEDWFDEVLGETFRQIHIDEKRGTPAVSLSVDFKSPARLGDSLVHRLRVLEIGRSSVKIEIVVTKEDETQVLVSTQTIVHCDLSGPAPRSLPLGEALRQGMERYLAPPMQAA